MTHCITQQDAQRVRSALGGADLIRFVPLCEVSLPQAPGVEFCTATGTPDTVIDRILETVEGAGFVVVPMHRVGYYWAAPVPPVLGDWTPGLGTDPDTVSWLDVRDDGVLGFEDPEAWARRPTERVLPSTVALLKGRHARGWYLRGRELYSAGEHPPGGHWYATEITRGYVSGRSMDAIKTPPRRLHRSYFPPGLCARWAEAWESGVPYKAAAPVYTITTNNTLQTWIGV